MERGEEYLIRLADVREATDEEIVFWEAKQKRSR
jgi:hypothetical protein